jgi:hypothetical protein
MNRVYRRTRFVFDHALKLESFLYYNKFFDYMIDRFGRPEAITILNENQLRWENEDV